jgi:DNA-binding winged helix-turn-helix (wHTH) protein
MYALPQNPFLRPGFWGRQREINVILRHVQSASPHCCALIGETSFGKTSLLRHLAGAQNQAVVGAAEDEDVWPFVYLDCISYVAVDQLEDQASARFWWDLYRATWTQVRQGEQLALSPYRVESGQSALDRAFEIKSDVEDLIREQTRAVVFLFDNFEGIARLPLRDSMWLRSLVQYPCAYVVASRHLLYLLYQYHNESWASPSPLWNLFTDPLYLGLMDEQEVQAFLLHARKQAQCAESLWSVADLDLIQALAGRHPELLRIACARLFERRLPAGVRTSEKDPGEVIYSSVFPICQLLWQSLTDPELWNTPGVISTDRRSDEKQPLSSYQQLLIDLAHGRQVAGERLVVLAQRGFVEQSAGSWRVFSDAMRRFVLEQEMQELARRAQNLSENTLESLAQSANEQSDVQAFTHLEEKVYRYLRSHVGNVCGRAEIKAAAWDQESESPGNSALQKIIERIRRKIEPEPDNPRYLIAVRGRGYMLRERPPEASPL